MHIDHINISGPFDLLIDVRQFYQNVFGLTEEERPSFGNRGFWLYHEDTALIHLSESDLHTREGGQGYLDHIAFKTTGLIRFVENLDQLNIPFKTEFIASIKLTQVFLLDPAGNKLEVNFSDEMLNPQPG